jgi:hypothetical protein
LAHLFPQKKNFLHCPHNNIEVDAARQFGTEHTSRIWTSESLDVPPSVPLLIATNDIVSGIAGKG